MRHHSLPWALVAGLAFGVPACSNDDSSTSGASTGGTSGNAGSAGSGDSAGSGGSGASGGSRASSGSSTGGAGGSSGAGGSGSSGGSGGNGSSGGSGGGGACTEIQIGSNLTVERSAVGDIASYVSTAVSPDIAVVGGVDQFAVQLYGVNQNLPRLVPGTFNLRDAAESNFATCSHCVFVFGLNGDRETAKIFFQESGSFTLTDVDDPLMDDVAGSLSNVKLVEVTIAPDFVSTPVPGGQCLTLASYTFDTVP